MIGESVIRFIEYLRNKIINHFYRRKWIPGIEVYMMIQNGIGECESKELVVLTRR